MLRSYAPDLLNTQWGAGLNGGETSVAHLTLRYLIDIAIKNQVSLALLFVDVASAPSAFASMIRATVFNQPEGYDLWMNLLRAAGFSDDEIPGVLIECAEVKRGNRPAMYFVGVMYTYMGHHLKAPREF